MPARILVRIPLCHARVPDLEAELVHAVSDEFPGVSAEIGEITTAKFDTPAVENCVRAWLQTFVAREPEITGTAGGAPRLAAA